MFLESVWYFTTQLQSFGKLVHLLDCLLFLGKYGILFSPEQFAYVFLSGGLFGINRIGN